MNTIVVRETIPTIRPTKFIKSISRVIGVRDISKLRKFLPLGERKGKKMLLVHPERILELTHQDTSRSARRAVLPLLAILRYFA